MLEFVGGQLRLNEIKKKFGIDKGRQKSIWDWIIPDSTQDYDFIREFKNTSDHIKDYEWVSNFTGTLCMFFIGGGDFYLKDKEKPWIDYNKIGGDYFCRALMYPVVKDRTYVVECGNGGLISKDYYDSGTHGSDEEEYDDAVKIYTVTIDFWSLSATSGEFRGKIGVSNLVHQVVYYEQGNNDIKINFPKSKNLTMEVSIVNTVGDIYINNEKVGVDYRDRHGTYIGKYTVVQMTCNKTITFIRDLQSDSDVVTDIRISDGLRGKTISGDSGSGGHISDHISGGGNGPSSTTNGGQTTTSGSTAVVARKYSTVSYFDNNSLSKNIFYGKRNQLWWDMNPFGNYELSDDFLYGLVLMYRPKENED